MTLTVEAGSENSPSYREQEDQLQGSVAGCQNNVAWTWMCGRGEEGRGHGDLCQGPGVDQEKKPKGNSGCLRVLSPHSMDAGVIHPQRLLKGDRLWARL